MAAISFAPDIKRKVAIESHFAALNNRSMYVEKWKHAYPNGEKADFIMVRVSCVLASCVLIAVLMAVPSTAYPSPSNYYRDEGPYEPEEIMDMLNRLGNLIQIERKMENYKDDITSEKRALDLGLSRGYSGALQAKHLMGIAAANYAGGPGRRRRDTSH